MNRLAPFGPFEPIETGDRRFVGRMPVPGGWLYLTEVQESYRVAVSTTFVPAPPTVHIATLLEDLLQHLSAVEDYMDGRADAETDGEGHMVPNREASILGDIRDKDFEQGLITRVRAARKAVA